MNRKKLLPIFFSLIAAVVLLLGIGPALPSGTAGLSAVSAEGEDAAPAAGEKKKLVMGTSPDYPPYENVDAKNNGEIVGMDIDIAKYITGRLGYELEIASMDFNGLIAALQTGRVDFVMSAMSATDERRQNVDFSDIYYVARNTIVSKKDAPLATLESLSGKRVGAQLGSTQDLFAETIEGAELKKLNKIPDLIQELNSGRIDAAIVEDAVAIEMTSANPGLVMNFLPAESDENGYAIAFPKNSPIVGDFNGILAEMNENGKMDDIVQTWFPDGEEKEARGLNIDFSVLKGYIPFILKGVYVTLLFTLVSALFGLIWGSILSLFKISGIKPLEWFATAYTSVFRGTPLLVQLTLIYYATPQLIHYEIPALMAAGLAFGLNSAAYLSETIRGGIMAVDKGQREAAIALGVPYRKMMVRIIFPQALRNILPALVNECVALLKESSLVSVIGVTELMRRADVVRSIEFRSFEVLLFVAAIYYVLVLILTSFARMLERRLRRSD
ncbi:ABC transporter substrate-binding protein/permease [Paenibacillus arenilitoris]|uniref:ABC transporter substrate-binding protein/permease n=1 Tax=Paenibacillus arenilitoris TaxID=2772299 RepID=A0A927CHI6_9BACL|nr:ABC transporter substrate-binding protein/permease [Paenibacillus arenilitoris]MBD2868199.1 ABC transporter substrate-binding protein/permease [Paenibacillus arenilitoris]